MFGFGSDKNVTVRRATTRIINESFDLASQLEPSDKTLSDLRQESRSKRTIPAVVIPYDGQPLPSGNAMQVGVIDGISCYGVAMTLTEAIPPDGDFLIVFGTPGFRQVFRSRCAWVQHLGLGTCRGGFELLELLTQSHYRTLLDYLESLESAAEEMTSCPS